MPDSTKRDIPAECAAFEGLLSTICLQKLVEFIGFDRSTIMMFSDDKKN
jgi:hypothetical protein